MTITHLTYVIIACFIVALFSPWLFLWMQTRDKKRTERLWRETLVYLKSATAYEAEDAIDRVERRQKTMMKKGLATMKKKSENLSDAPAADMAADIRTQLEKKYDNDMGSGA